MIDLEGRTLRRIGLASLALATVVAVAPLPAGTGSAVAPVVPGKIAIVVIALVTVGLVVDAALSAVATDRSSLSRGRFEGVDGAGQAGTSTSDRIFGDSNLSDGIEVGDGIDEAIAAVDEKESGVQRYRDRRDVHGRITRVAVAVLTESEGVSREEAANMLEDGRWTDRPRAAVFLGGSDVPPLPLTIRIRDWLSGHAFERQVRATIVELAERAGVETEVAAP